MRRIFSSAYRITSRSLFLAISLFLGLIFWHLPELLNLDAFRPQLVEVLETTFRCKVLVGSISARLVPKPGLGVGHVVFLENTPKPRILASVSYVHLSVKMASLYRGHLEFESVRFNKPRLLVHRFLDSSGHSRWSMLRPPSSTSTQGNKAIRDWQIRSGNFELWDHAATPTAKWVTQQFNGSFDVPTQIGSMNGKAPKLGSRARLDLHYDGKKSYPLEALLSDVDLAVLQPLVPTSLMTLGGSTEVLVKADFEPSLRIQVHLNQPAGVGLVKANIAPGLHRSWNWSAAGKDYILNGTTFSVQEWSAKNDPQGLAVYVQGNTHQGGTAEVAWTRLAGQTEPTLDVNVSSVTIRQILDIFHLPPKSYGYEPWVIREGSMRGVVHNQTTLEVIESDVQVAGMHLDLAGTFGLKKPNPVAHIEGGLLHIPVSSIVESFFTPPSSVTGTGVANFNLTFPLTADWLKGLNGPLHIEVEKGTLRTLKTMYRIFSVLNLGNYLRLRMPKISAEGILFETITGWLVFQNGHLYTEDLFLKSPDMNIGFKGTVDLPGKNVEGTLRLEMLRFLEDILKFVPITHWIFKKPNKIFLPLVVTVDGPWDNPNIH